MIDFPDKRTDPWPLVFSPVPVSLIFLAYLCVVWLTPRLMKHRQPVDLRVVLIVYNFAMVCLSAYMFHEVCTWKPNEVSRASFFIFVAALSSLFVTSSASCWWCFIKSLYKCFTVPGHILALRLQLPLSASRLQHQPAGNEGRDVLFDVFTHISS